MILRCSNCGWDNKGGSLQCEKCDTRLSLRVDQPLHNSINNKKNGLHGTGTIKGKQVENIDETLKNNPFVSEPPLDTEPQNHSEKTKNCPNSNCGFINLSGRSTCIKCQTVLDPPESTENQAAKTPDIKKEPAENPSSKFNNTIDPYREKKPVKESFKLSLIPLVSENRINPAENSDSLADRLFECYEGESIILNRSNVEPDNYTITSSKQAELSREGDKWYLIDKSSKKTTFILVSQKTELQDGDIILMGDRKIIFNTDTHNSK